MNHILSNLKLCVLCLFLSSNASSQVTADTLQLHINEHNTIYVTAVVNQKDTLTLNFDTGCTDLILTTEVLKKKLSDSIQLYHKNYSLQIGKSVFSTKVYDATLTGHGTEGLPFIEAEIIQSGKSSKDYFLFDTGYQRTAMLDNEELKKNNFPIHKMRELRRVIMHGAKVMRFL